MLYFFLCFAIGFWWARSWRVAFLAPIALVAAFAVAGLIAPYVLNMYGAQNGLPPALGLQLFPLSNGGEAVAQFAISAAVGILLSIAMFGLKRLIRGPVERWR